MGKFYRAKGSFPALIYKVYTAISVPNVRTENLELESENCVK